MPSSSVAPAIESPSLRERFVLLKIVGSRHDGKLEGRGGGQRERVRSTIAAYLLIARVRMSLRFASASRAAVRIRDISPSLAPRRFTSIRLVLRRARVYGSGRTKGKTVIERDPAVYAPVYTLAFSLAPSSLPSVFTETERR